MKMLLGRGQWRMPSLPRSPGGQGYFMFLSLIQTWRDPYWWNFQVAYRSVRQQITKTSNSRNLNHAMWRVNAVVVKGCNITAATANACDGQTLRLCMPDLLWSCPALLCVSLFSINAPFPPQQCLGWRCSMWEICWSWEGKRWRMMVCCSSSYELLIPDGEVLQGKLSQICWRKRHFFFLLPLTSQGLFFSELLTNNLLECAECCPPYFLHNCQTYVRGGERLLSGGTL